MYEGQWKRLKGRVQREEKSLWTSVRCVLCVWKAVFRLCSKDIECSTGCFGQDTLEDLPAPLHSQKQSPKLTAINIVHKVCCWPWFKKWELKASMLSILTHAGSLRKHTLKIGSSLIEPCLLSGESSPQHFPQHFFSLFTELKLADLSCEK